MDLFREKHIPQTEYRPLQKVSVVVKSGVVSFYGLGNIICYFGKRWRFPGIGPLPTAWSFDSALELSLEPLSVSFSLLIEDQGLVEVNLSSVLDPFDSNKFTLYLCHAFKSCVLSISLLLQF